MEDFTGPAEIVSESIIYAMRPYGTWIAATQRGTGVTTRAADNFRKEVFMFGSPDVNPHVKRDMEEQWETEHRRHRILSVVLLLLVLALAGGGWYAYQELR